MASENACALQSREKYYFSKQNITSNVLNFSRHKKTFSFGTNFVILNIFWKQKIVKTSERKSHCRSPYTLGHHLPMVGAESEAW